jgi:hypothetical protein
MRPAMDWHSANNDGPFPVPADRERFNRTFVEVGYNAQTIDKLIQKRSRERISNDQTMIMYPNVIVEHFGSAMVRVQHSAVPIDDNSRLKNTVQRVRDAGQRQTTRVDDGLSKPDRSEFKFLQIDFAQKSISQYVLVREEATARDGNGYESPMTVKAPAGRWATRNPMPALMARPTASRSPSSSFLGDHPEKASRAGTQAVGVTQRWPLS